MRKKGTNFIISGVITLLIIFLCSNCTKDPVSPTLSEDQKASINDYIQKLSYDPEALLNYQNTGGGSSSSEVISADTSTSNSSNEQLTCVSTTYNLRENFENIAILRPTSGVIWPGALVKGNQSMMDGLPDPITLSRAPVTFKIDLPGIGESGVQTVENPTNSSIQAAIDKSLEWWNANAYQEGYVNSASSFYKVKKAYSSKQIALEVGLSAQWATGDVSAQFNYQSSDEKTVVMAVYKQAFYTITMDSPRSPEAVFGKDVTLEQVKGAMDNAAPPAYIQSVTYGRIIMFRMETSYKASGYVIESAFKYAAGVSVDGALEAEYQEILKNSSVELIVLGGNAAVSSRAVSAKSANDLVPIIEGDNAVYSRNNPGVPVSYTIRYLKDNSLAKLGYFTEYTATECSSIKTVDDIDIKLERFNIKRDCDGIEGPGDFSFEVEVLDKNGSKLSTYSMSSITKSDGEYVNISKTISIKLNRTPGNKFTVKFICNEWDQDILGRVYKDSRMSSKTVQFTHNFDSNSRWSDISGVRSLLTNPGSDCSTELIYSISVH